LFYQALSAVLDITMDEELDVDDYLPNLNRMYNSKVMGNVIGSVTGTVKFYGLTKTSMKLEGLDKHQSLIESYKKLHRARQAQY
jgi:ribosomal protein S12 methylthiotransferase accessory factor